MNTNPLSQWLKARETTSAQFAEMLTQMGIPTKLKSVEEWRHRRSPRWLATLMRQLDALVEIETAIANARLAHGRNAQATVAQELERAAQACAKLKTE